jgi:hypothetical protein
MPTHEKTSVQEHALGFIDEVGKRYGQLHVIRHMGGGGTGRRKSAMFECVCECGEIITVRGRDLRSGHKNMCAACYNMVHK